MNNNLILTGGIGRSGTSIFTKLIASSENSEMFYEPAVPFYLLNNFEKYDLDEWQKIFKVSIYDDLLKNAIAGRNINLNKNDTSSIYNYKLKSEINKRLKKSYTQFGIQENIENINPVIKVLENIWRHILIKDCIDVTSIAIIRNPKDTINSLIRKGWFSDDQLSIKSPNPSRSFKIKDGFRIYKFVEDANLVNDWVKMDETKRTIAYYEWHINKYLDLALAPVEKFLVFSYDNLINNPIHSTNVIYSKLGLKKGGMTDGVIESINKSNNIEVSFIKDVSKTDDERLSNLFDQINRLTINKIN